MYEEDEEICPVCDSTCTCNHQPKDRGSARANGYRPKAGVARRADGLRPSFTNSASSLTNPSTDPKSSTSASPLKIRLILGRRSGAGDPPALPREQNRRLASPSTSPPLRRKRSPAYSSESSSESSSTESRLNGSSSRESSNRQRTSGHVPGAGISQSPRGGANFASTSGAGPSKPHALGGRTPSAAWNLEAPSSKSDSRGNGASRKPTGTRASGFPPSQLGAASSSTKREKGPKAIASTKHKKAVFKPSPKAALNGGRQVKASPKKRRKLGYTPSPSPPRKSGRTSTSESEVDDYGSRHATSWDSGSRRGRKPGVPSGSGVVLGRPVGVVIPTFVPKPFPSSSSSSQGESDDEGDDNALNDDMDEGLRKEEERMILREERRREKMRRNHSRQGRGEKVHRRLKHQLEVDAFMGSDLTSLSSSAHHSADSSSSCSESSDGNEEDDEGDDGLGEDQDLEFGAENPEWVHSDPEDDTDADLFFANFLSGGEDDDEAEDETSKPTKVATKFHNQQKEQQQENPMADHGFGINEGEIFVAADAFDQFQAQLPSPNGKSRHYRKTGKFEQPLVVTENSDGHLVFADGWGSSHGDIVNAEWDAAILIHDEDVTSEESELNLNPGEEEDGPSTETDFDGDTTVDEGLDEDGLPPTMAAQSQQRQSEREWLLKEMELDGAVPVPENLPDGAEAFQGVYFGRSEFPAVKLDTSVPSIAQEVTADDWKGILDRREASPASYFPEIEHPTFGSPISMLQRTPQPDHFTALGLSTMPSLAGPRSDQHLSTNEEGGLTGKEETSISPQGPPSKKLPLMGTFAPSPPVQDQPLEVREATQMERLPVAMPPPPSTPNNSATPKARRIQSKPQSCLLPVAQKGMAVLDGKKTVTVPSPFAGVKRRKKRRVVEESDGSLSVSQSSDHVILRNGGIEQGGSRSGRSSFSTPYTPLGNGRKGLLQQASIDSLFPQILPSAPVPMDLSDVLDYAILDGSSSDNNEPHDGPDQVGAAIRNLTRWQHVPMGTFRHARAFGSVGTDAELAGMSGRPRRPSVSDGFSYGATPRPAAMSASALWSDVIDVKGKGKAREEQDVSLRKKRNKCRKEPSIAAVAAVLGADEMEVDVVPITGVGEEEMYFSKKHHKGGREGTERLRMKKKFGEKERKNGVIGTGPRTSPLHDRIKASAATAAEGVAGPSSKGVVPSQA